MGEKGKGKGGRLRNAEFPPYIQSARTHARTETEIDFPVGLTPPNLRHDMHIHIHVYVNMYMYYIYITYMYINIYIGLCARQWFVIYMYIVVMLVQKLGSFMRNSI